MMTHGATSREKIAKILIAFSIFVVSADNSKTMTIIALAFFMLGTIIFLFGDSMEW